MVNKADTSGKSPKSDETTRRRGRGPAKSPTRVPAEPRRSPGRAKTVKKEASPAKPAKRSPARSPRKKSQVRSSPSRTSPSRTSPSRKIEARRQMPSRKSKEVALQKSDVVTLDSESDSESYSTKPTRSQTSNNKEFAKPLNNTNQSSKVDKPKLKPNYEPIVRLTQFSDDEKLSDKLEYTITKPARKPVNHLRTICVTSTFLLECCLIFGLTSICMGKKCVYRLPSLADLKSLRNLIDVSILLTLSSYVLFHAILSVIPIGGRKVSGMVYTSAKNEYVLNGLFTFFLNLCGFVALEVYHIPIASYVTSNIYKFLMASFLISLVLGFLLFVKALFTNAASKLEASTLTNSHLVNFLVGSEINPRFFGLLDVKFVIYRLCLLIIALIGLAVNYLSLEVVPTNEAMEILGIEFFQTIRVKPTVLLCSMMFTAHAVDGLLFEHNALSTMEFKAQTCGVRSINQYLTGAFLHCALLKYVFDNNVELESWHLFLTTGLFLMGYVIFRGSNSQKHAFRENPYSPRVANLESIPTAGGKKLLCSGYWGIVRHPNYLGDILITVALMQFILNSPLVLVGIFVIGNLIARAFVDNKNCKTRYGSAWDRYCNRVKYILVPRVF